jgi:hypothetical protein
LEETLKQFEGSFVCRSLLEPRQGSTFHVDFQAIVQ